MLLATGCWLAVSQSTWELPAYLLQNCSRLIVTDIEHIDLSEVYCNFYLGISQQMEEFDAPLKRFRFWGRNGRFYWCTVVSNGCRVRVFGKHWCQNSISITAVNVVSDVSAGSVVCTEAALAALTPLDALIWKICLTFKLHGPRKKRHSHRRWLLWYDHWKYL